MKTENKLSQFLNLIMLILLIGLWSCNSKNDSFQDSAISTVETNFNYQDNLNKIEALTSEIQENEGFYRRTSNFNKSKSNNRNIGFPIWHLDRTALIHTYLGLSIKGSGGGGGFVDGIDILNKIQELDIYDISTVDDNKLYIVAGGIGAPTALKSNLTALIQSIKSSVFTLANLEGKELGGILSVESGSANSTIAMLLSKELNLPLINADGAGRAVPKLSNLSYAHETYSIAPTILTSVANPEVDVEILQPKDADDAEKLIRATISKPGFGQIGGLALWVQTGNQLKASSIIKNTFSDAYKLGIYTFSAMYKDINQLDLYFKNTNQFISSYQGTLVSFNVKTQKGFDVTTLTVKLDNGNTITIKALNENLLLISTGGNTVTAPHIISYMIEVKENTFIPFNNGDADTMKSLIGKKIHIVNAFSSKRLYDYEDTFLQILKEAFNYFGTVEPPAPKAN